MIVCAPFPKSPNCASHKTSASACNYRIAILKPKHAFFRNELSKTSKRASGFDSERNSESGAHALPVCVSYKNSVTLAERAASGILSAQTHARAFEHERAKRDCFRKRPIERQRCRRPSSRVARVGPPSSD